MEYTLTNDEIGAVGFVRGRYVWADIVHVNLDGNKLLLDNMTQHEIWDSIQDEGTLPLLNEKTGLYKFLMSLEPV